MTEHLKICQKSLAINFVCAKGRRNRSFFMFGNFNFFIWFIRAGGKGSFSMEWELFWANLVTYIFKLSLYWLPFGLFKKFVTIHCPLSKNLLPIFSLIKRTIFYCHKNKLMENLRQLRRSKKKRSDPNKKNAEQLYKFSRKSARHFQFLAINKNILCPSIVMQSSLRTSS